jgi:hypothetical protein
MPHVLFQYAENRIKKPIHILFHISIQYPSQSLFTKKNLISPHTQPPHTTEHHTVCRYPHCTPPPRPPHHRSLGRAAPTPLAWSHPPPPHPVAHSARHHLSVAQPRPSFRRNPSPLPHLSPLPTRPTTTLPSPTTTVMASTRASETHSAVAPTMTPQPTTPAARAGLGDGSARRGVLRTSDA